MNRALITGISGQDASYLAEFLIGKGYEVHGTTRRTSTPNLNRVEHILNKIEVHQADLLDQGSLINLMTEVRPTEVYNLAAQSFVPTSWSQPVYTAEVTGLGVLRVLEAARTLPQDERPRIYIAGSSEMYGDVAEEPQNEDTILRARSPYGAAKIFGHQIAKVYRESYGMFVARGILFNHESERRGLEFVTRKITDHVARQVHGLTEKPLELGNLDAKRDWSFAGDVVEAMWLMLQHDKPDDFVIASGEAHTIREFAQRAYAEAGVTVDMHGSGINEVGVVTAISTDWPGIYVSRKVMEVNPRFYRPAEVQTLTGDYSKAKRVLGWEPKVSFNRLVGMMMEADLARYAL